MKVIPLYITAFMLIASCTDPKQKLLNQIKSGEKDLFADSTMVPARDKAGEMIKLYTAFALQYKNDSMAPEYLFKAGDLANNMHEPQKAIELFSRVHDYPEFPKAPLALFLQGFIAETELGDMEQARKYYETFLQKYPNHQLANDVQSSLFNLGKSPEELIREFESNNKDSVAVK